MSNDHEILDLLELWFQKLDSGAGCAEAAAEIAQLYAEDAVLVPTLWNGPCYGRHAIRNYFEREFLPIRPKGFLINYALHFAGDIAINSGHYVFEIDDCEESGDCDTAEVKEEACCKRVKKPGRFTFVYKKLSVGWSILSHHSSKMPEEHSLKAIRWIKSESFV